MPNIDIYHRPMLVGTAGPLGNPVLAAHPQPDGTYPQYRAQIGPSQVDREMAIIAPAAVAAGGSAYMCALVDYLIAGLTAAIATVPDRADAVVVFTAPEFFFKEAPRVVQGAMRYGVPFTQGAFYDGSAHLRERLEQMKHASVFGDRTVVCCAGTMWWGQPGAQGVFVVTNIAPVYESSAGHMWYLEKHTASPIDGLHVNAGEVWDRNTEGVPAMWARIDQRYPHPALETRVLGARLSIGVEICLDFLHGRLRASGARPDLHIVTACGAPLAGAENRVAARPGGLFVRCDGMPRPQHESSTATVDNAGVHALPEPLLQPLPIGTNAARIALYPAQRVTI